MEIITAYVDSSLLSNEIQGKTYLVYNFNRLRKKLLLLIHVPMTKATPQVEHLNIMVLSHGI